MATILLQRFANREVRLGFQSISKASKKKGDKYDDRQQEAFAKKVLDLQVSLENSKGGFELGYDRYDRAIAVPYTLEQHERCKSRLDIISEFQQRKLRNRYKGGWGFAPKITAFGKNGRHRILEAGAIIDQKYGKNVAMVTCTIPGSTREALRTVANWSGWIMNRITQIVRRSSKDVGWFYVFELQKRGALHLHFAIGSSDLRDALDLAKKIKSKWFEALLELEAKAGVDVFKKNERWTWRHLPKNWKFDIQAVRKSVAAYFSKYAGKQSGVVNRTNRTFCPARWWGSSKSIKRGIENARIKISIEISLPKLESALSFLRTAISSCNSIKSYRYDFDLGTSASGAILGGGWREISYFDGEGFNSISSILCSLGEYVTQTWGIYADIPCLRDDKITHTWITGETQI